MWEQLDLGYTEPAGHPLLREEIAALYETVPPEGVLVFSGAEEVIFALANVVAGDRPGRRAAVVWPAYQSLHEVARSAGAEVDLLELRTRTGGRWIRKRSGTSSGRRRASSSSTFRTTPPAPSPDEGTFRRAVGVARGAGATLLSDEVYRLLEHDPADRLPAAADLQEGAVSLG
jgi:aspartate/methionine/tyrosine aminotransferase